MKFSILNFQFSTKHIRPIRLTSLIVALAFLVSQLSLSCTLVKGTFTSPFSFLISPAFAQTPPPLDLTVSPPVLEINAKPGDTIKEKFRVRNNSQTAINLSVSARKLASSPVNGEPVPQDPTPEDEFINWVKFEPTNFRALPREWKDVNFTISIPKTAAYGYYYVFRIGPDETNTLEGSGASLKGELLIPTLLNIKKEGAKADAKVLSFKTSSQILEYLPAEFVTRIENKGNIHIKPRGNIFIRSGNQKDIAIIDVNSRLSSVLPGGTRTFTSEWNDGFLVQEQVVEEGAIKTDSKGKPVTKLKFNWNKLTSFRIGPYTASMLMVYDDGKRDIALEGSTTFWVIPYKALAIITVSVVGLALLARFLLKWYIKREIRKQRKLPQ